jgi:hypothetical protein
MHFQKVVSERNNLIFEKLEQEFKILKSEEKDDFINYWIANHIWFDSFADFRAMSSNNINKQSRKSNSSRSDKKENSRSYSQSRKNEDVSKQYIKSYEKYIFTKDLNINDFKDEKLVSSNNKMIYKDFQDITCEIISSIVYFKTQTLDMIKLCRNRNEAMINRDITSLIVSSIKLLYLKNEVNQFEYFIDEVNTQWYENWVLTKSRSKSDLIVDLFFFRFYDSRKWKINQLYVLWKLKTINRRFVFFVSDVRDQVWQWRAWLC